MARPNFTRFDRVDDLPLSLGKVSGVYVIASKQTGAVYYVGESHTNQLRKTLFRHFQQWHDKEQERATYDRQRVTVIVYITPASQAVEFQNELICELQPRDALLGCEVTEEKDPF